MLICTIVYSHDHVIYLYVLLPIHCLVFEYISNFTDLIVFSIKIFINSLNKLFKKKLFKKFGFMIKYKNDNIKYFHIQMQLRRLDNSGGFVVKLKKKLKSHRVISIQYSKWTLLKSCCFFLI